MNELAWTGCGGGGGGGGGALLHAATIDAVANARRSFLNIEQFPVGK
jgi:hypothetical protein